VACKAVKAAVDLAAYLAGLDEAFLRVHSEDIEKRIGELAEWVEKLRDKWQQLEDPAKLEELAKTIEWRQSKVGRGEYAPVDTVPELFVTAVKARGRLVIGGYAYVLSSNGKWLQRYARSNGEKRGGVNG
jgi:predicted nuclease with TOPRIM domain